MKLMIAPNGRLYAPEIGRFLSRDPQDGLDGTYTYVGNAPPSHVDADGATNGTKKGDAQAQKLIKEAKKWIREARDFVKKNPDRDIPPLVKKELVGKRALMRLYVGFTGELKVSPKMRARLLKRIKVITMVLALGGKPVPEDEPEKPKPEKPKPEKPKPPVPDEDLKNWTKQQVKDLQTLFVNTKAACPDPIGMRACECCDENNTFYQELARKAAVGQSAFAQASAAVLKACLDKARHKDPGQQFKTGSEIIEWYGNKFTAEVVGDQAKEALEKLAPFLPQLL